MNDSPESGRSALFREAVVFQLKLMADGFRDLLLVPLSFFAALAGLLRGGDEPDREFRQVLELGRRSERWINLFDNHPPTAEEGQAATLDGLLSRAEETLREQTRNGRISARAAQSIERAINAAQQTAQRGEDPENPEDPKTDTDQ